MFTSKWVKYTITIILFFLFINGVRVFWINQLQPSIENINQTTPGEINLSDIGTELIPLKGDWSFYPGQLLSDNQIKQNSFSHFKESKQYPQDWLKLSESDKYTYGTFHMRIHLNDELMNESLSITVPNTRLATKLFVNEEEIGSSGTPAEQQKEFVASLSPYTAEFIPKDNSIDVILHVANNGLTPNVPEEQILFGKTDAINQHISIAKLSKISFGIIVLLLSIISIYLYFRLKKQESLLYFSLMMAMLMMMVLFDYDQILLLDLPIDYNLKSKMIRLVYALISLFSFLFLNHFLRNKKTTNLYRFYPYLNAIYIIFIIISPIQLIFHLSKLLAIIILIPGIFFVHRMILEKNVIENALLLLLMVIALLNNIIWAIIKSNVEGIHFNFYPIDLLLAILLFIFYWLEIHLKRTKENEQLKDELIEKDKSKDEFLAVTSHELRNPLHSMINIAQYVKDNPNNEIQSKDKDDLHLLLSVGKRMSVLINDLLDLTLLNENRLRLEKKSINLHDIVNVTIDMLSYLLESKPVIIINGVNKEFQQVYADENRLIQILLNLLHNAIKFTEEGEIIVTATTEEAHEMAFIHIKDDGKGMDPQFAEEIFQSYTKSETHDGIGLGLKVTKELVENHGGEISVRFNLQQGSTFTFSLPLSKQKEHSIVNNTEDDLSVKENVREEIDLSVETNQTSDTDKPKILIVDDDYVNLKVVSTILSTENYELYLATNGKEALQKMEQMTFDLVITDIMMPVMSGFELTKTIRQQYDLSELPIIMLTARGRLEDMNVGFQSGANDFVVKPVDSFELKARVRVLTDLQTAVKKQLTLEAAWLRAQINPHFLLNTMTSIMMLARKDTAKMNYLLNKFIHYLKTSFDFHNKKDLVLLKDELELIDSYLTIEQERFGDRIEINWEIDESLDILIPPLAIQTIVENAINHGILPKYEGGTITLRSDESDHEVKIMVKDNGVGMSKEMVEKLQQQQFSENSGIGIVNTDKRLQKWLGTKLSIESELQKGTTMIIHVKKQKGKESNKLPYEKIVH